MNIPHADVYILNKGKGPRHWGTTGQRAAKSDDPNQSPDRTFKTQSALTERRFVNNVQPFVPVLAFSAGYFSGRGYLVQSRAESSMALQPLSVDILALFSFHGLFKMIFASRLVKSFSRGAV